jgi:hypothetical protein
MRKDSARMGEAFEMLDNLRSRASSLVDVGASPSALKHAPKVLLSRRL